MPDGTKIIHLNPEFKGSDVRGRLFRSKYHEEIRSEATIQAYQTAKHLTRWLSSSICKELPKIQRDKKAELRAEIRRQKKVLKTCEKMGVEFLNAVKTLSELRRSKLIKKSLENMKLINEKIAVSEQDIENLNAQLKGFMAIEEVSKLTEKKIEQGLRRIRAGIDMLAAEQSSDLSYLAVHPEWREGASEPVFVISAAPAIAGLVEPVAQSMISAGKVCLRLAPSTKEQKAAAMDYHKACRRTSSSDDLPLMDCSFN